MRLKLSFVSSIICLFITSMAYTDTNVDYLLEGLKSYDKDSQYVSFHKLIKYAADDSINKTLVEYVKNKFDEREKGIKFECSYGSGSDIYIDFLSSLISLRDKRTLPAIIAGSDFLGGGGIADAVLSYSNEAVPYLIDAMKDKKYYGKAADLTHWLINYSNCTLTDKENKDLKKALLTGYYDKHYGFDKPWLSSIVLRLSPDDKEIKKYMLIENINSVLTNTDNISLGWVPGNINKIKVKRIKSLLVPIVKNAYKVRLNKKIIINENKFKAGLKKNLSVAKKNETYNKYKEYLEGERQKVILELSNTLVELEKE